MNEIIEDSKENDILKNQIYFFFNSIKEYNTFIKQSRRKKKTLYMLNRLSWFTSLADQQKYDSVKIFFFIAMAEIMIKLSENRYNKNNLSTKDVERFFNLFPKNEKRQLRDSFKIMRNDNTLSSTRPMDSSIPQYRTVINIFLNIRHSIVHGREHYQFLFHDGNKELLNIIHGKVGGPRKKRKIVYECLLQYNEFKKIMITNSLKLIQGNI